MRIAYFSPLSPQRSGISDYSEDLLPLLADHVDLDLFVDGFTPTNPAIARQFTVYDAAEYPGLHLTGRYAGALYHMGNSHYHEAIYRTLVRYPGIVVLHDFILHAFISEITQRRGDPSGFIREMAYAHGRIGADVAREHIRTAGDYPALEYPLSRRVLDASLLVIVHSQFVAGQVRTLVPGAPVVVIPHPILTTPLTDRVTARNRLGLPSDAFVVGSFGLATPEKRYHVALPAFRRVLEHYPDAQYVVVGEVPSWYPLSEMVDGLGLAGHVRLTGRVDLETLGSYLSAVDVCANLRFPTMGETSGSLLRILTAGQPVVVSNVGTFGELPDDVCRKVPVGVGEEDALTAVLVDLAGDDSLRRQLGSAARTYVDARHDIRAVARAYARAVASVFQDT